MDTAILPAALSTARVQTGETLEELSQASGLLVVFLRHGGCPFCRETLAELAEKRSAIEQAGVRLVLIHMMTDEQAAALFSKYHLGDVARISDPGLELYRAFSLKRGTPGDVMGPKVWWRGFKSVVLAGHLPGRPIGDIFQMPGAFLLAGGEVVKSFRGRNSSERPDYVELARS